MSGDLYQKFLNSKYLPSLTHGRILALIVLTATLIEIYVASSLSLWNDEAITANAAISVIENGVPSFPSGSEYWRAFPHTLLAAASGHLFGINDLSLRLPSIILSSATVVLTYLTCKEFFDRDTGLIGSTLLAFSALQIALSTQVRMYALLQFLYLLSILLIYRFVERRKKRDLLFLTASLILISFVHVTGYILFFVALSYWIYRTDLSKASNKLSIVGIPVLILALATILQLTERISFLHILGKLTFNPENIYFYYEFVFKHIPFLSVLGLTGSILAFRKNLRSTVLLSGSIFPALYIYILHYDGVAGRYIYFSLPILTIWAGLTIKAFSEKAADLIRNSFDRDISVKYIIIFLTLTGLLAGSGFDYDFTEGDYRVSFDQKSVYNHIEDNSDRNDTLITQWTPSATYYYRVPDYSLYGDKSVPGYNPSYYRDEYSFEGRDVYSGAEFIDNNRELLDKIKQSESGWIVLRDFSYRVKSEEIKNTISNLPLIGEFTGLKVWRWNKSVSISDNTSSNNK